MKTNRPGFSERTVNRLSFEKFTVLLQVLRSSVVEISLCVYILKQLFFSISVNSGRIFTCIAGTSISKNNCSTKG